MKKEIIYNRKSDGILYSPFNLSIDDMKKLILINFEKDPDELYTTFELQESTDRNGVPKLLVIAYGNGFADIYHQPLFPFASQKSVLNNPTFFERPMVGAKFEIKDNTLEIYFNFKDKNRREINVSLLETRLNCKKPFFLLAPIGANSKNPDSLPIYSLYNMSFTKQKYTDISIEINSKAHRPDTFILPFEWCKSYFTRYSADVFNVDWNKNHMGELSKITFGNKGIISANGVTYELRYNDGHPEIKVISAANSEHKVKIKFMPAFPDIVCLSDGTNIDGEFSITTDNSPGIIQGVYNVKKAGIETDIEINPSKGWYPNQKRLIMKILFFVVSIFKKWPKSYIWKAKIWSQPSDRVIMNSYWKRV